MADYDKEHGKIFGVVENNINNKTVIEPEILEKPTDFITDLLKEGGFYGLTLVLMNKAINFFPTKKLAEDFLEKILEEEAMRNDLATH